MSMPCRLFPELTGGAIGLIESVCPSCLAALVKRPKSKTKCPHCREFIFCRTRPLDRERVLVTAEQAHEIEKAWDALASPPIDHLERERKHYEGLLEIKIDTPKELLAVLETESDKAVYFNHWGIYTGIQSTMGTYYSVTGNHEDALRFFYLSFYLDFCGATNSPAKFDSHLAWGPPVAISAIRQELEATQWSQAKAWAEFRHVVEQLRPLEPPISVSVAWEELWRYLGQP